jgi:nucleotide-binding universal stress UspA family protein
MSFPYKRILCPVDFDDNCGAAVKEAAALAEASGGQLLLLHVVHINPLASEGFVLGQLEESQTKDARTKLTQLAELEIRGKPREIAVEIGEPGDVILSTQKERQIDLVVMATHGRHGVARLVLGSLAERIVRLSPVPVLTVHPVAN